jgi:hypothetical protein
VSDDARQILDKFGTFQMELRGEVELKGKGRVTTHWLLGCSEPDPRPPTPRPCSGTPESSPYPLLFPASSCAKVKVKRRSPATNFFKGQNELKCNDISSSYIVLSHTCMSYTLEMLNMNITVLSIIRYVTSVEFINAVSLFRFSPQRPTTDIPEFRMMNCEA